LGIDKKLLEILACPSCKGDIKEVEGGNSLKCVECGLVYPVRDGIPIMLIDEAKKDKPK
jgi:uncharacterized protein YbaR (Trm112 family)